MCVVSGCPVHLPVDFLEFSSENRNHHRFSDDAGCHELQLVCHCEVSHCEVEDEDAACGFPPWLSVIPPFGLAIDIVIEVFSSFELLILSLKLLMWTYRYQRLLRFRQVSISHFQALFLKHRQILVAVEEFLGPISIQTKNPMSGVL